MTGSQGHAALIAEPMARLGIPVLGAVQRRADIVMPERHLGLVQAGESTTLEQHLDMIAATVASGVDLDRLVAAAGPLALAADGEASSLPPPGQRIALAQDRAFSFVYAHILAGWRRAGAEIMPFSPLADEAPASGLRRGVAAGRLPGAACGRARRRVAVP